MDMQGSRRAFVGGAVASAAVLGPLALFGRGWSSADTDAADGRIKVVPGGAPGDLVNHRPDPKELARWERAVGQSFQVTGEDGARTATVAMVVVELFKGSRPASIRQQPFSVYFTFDRGDVFGDDRMYDVAHPIEGLTRLFLSRGGERFGKAIMVALFN